MIATGETGAAGNPFETVWRERRSGPRHHAGVAQAGDLPVRIADLAQDLVGVLAERRRARGRDTLDVGERDRALGVR